jgi:prepilin-type N-terminal cleavage/methylation domain-containing protein
MGLPTGSSRNVARAGFTLIELLLVVVLILLLLAAAVFNFASLQRNAQLDEGATQFEALLRFARAHSASTGHPVMVALEADASGSFSTTNAAIQVLWEPDPLGEPGVLAPVFEARSYAEGIAGLVSIQEVRLIDAVPVEVASAPGLLLPEETPTPSTIASPAGTNLVSALQPFPRLTFYPDGTSDSAEVILVSRDAEDVRRLAVKLIGETGVIRRRIITDELNPGEPEPEDLWETNAPPELGRSP